jgi:hypothetical protein
MCHRCIVQQNSLTPKIPTPAKFISAASEHQVDRYRSATAHGVEVNRWVRCHRGNDRCEVGGPNPKDHGEPTHRARARGLLMESDFNNLKSYQRCQSSKRTPVAVSDRRTRRKNWISSCSSTIDACDEAQAAPALEIATAPMERLSFDDSEPWAYATAPSLINWLADQSERRSAIKTISHYLIKIAGPPGNKVIFGEGGRNCGSSKGRRDAYQLQAL